MNAAEGIKWVAGIKHPTFVWDDANIPADYTAVNEAIAAAEKFDKALYSNYAAVEVSKLLTEPRARQSRPKLITWRKPSQMLAALQYKDC